MIIKFELILVSNLDFEVKSSHLTRILFHWLLSICID